MKKILIRFAFLPFALAIAFAVKVYAGKLFNYPPTEITTPIPNPDAAPNIQVALLLDVSGSMSGLIEQAKSQLWQIVNELGEAKYDAYEPNLEIALYIYGGDDLPVNSGYVKQLTPLTTDLDLISEELFKLGTNGGSEYCGKVIQTATLEQKWADSKEDLKMIFIAGNEPFSQGPVMFSQACKEAFARDIIINTIFCGNFDEGVRTQWKEGATIGGGQYMNIDHNKETVYIESPYDQQINQLNSKLNETYISYGYQGQQLKQRQVTQDVNASSYNQANLTKRAISKSKKVYKNTHWDLVDAAKEKDFKVESIEKKHLDAELQKLSNEELELRIKEKTAERERIQQEIRDLDTKRKVYVAEKRKETATDSTALDQVLIKTVKEQAKKKKYEFK